MRVWGPVVVCVRLCVGVGVRGFWLVELLL